MLLWILSYSLSNPDISVNPMGWGTNPEKKHAKCRELNYTLNRGNKKEYENNRNGSIV